MVMEGGRAILRDNLLAWSFGKLGFLGLFIWLSHNLPFYLMPRLNTWKRKAKKQAWSPALLVRVNGCRSSCWLCPAHPRYDATDTCNLKAQKGIRADDFVHQ